MMKLNSDIAMAYDLKQQCGYKLPLNIFVHFIFFFFFSLRKTSWFLFANWELTRSVSTLVLWNHHYGK